MTAQVAKLSLALFGAYGAYANRYAIRDWWLEKTMTDDDLDERDGVVYIHDAATYNYVMKKKKVIVEYSAEWCKACKEIAPFYHSLSPKYKDIVFATVDLEEQRKDTKWGVLDIPGVPAFYFYKNKEDVATVLGSNSVKLLSTVNHLNQLGNKPTAAPSEE